MTTKAPDLRKVVLPVEGMTCAACVSHVEGALKEVAGVVSASVNLATEEAAVEFDGGRASLTDLIGAVDDSGYRTGLASITLNVGGMTCASCVIHVEHALRDVEGVLAVNVNLASEQAAVEYLPGLAALPEMRHAVSDAGYSVEGVAGRRGRPRRGTTGPHPRDRQAAATDAGGVHTWRGHLPGQLPRAVPLGAVFPPELVHAMGAGHPCAVVGRLAVLPGRVGRTEAPHRQHEHPHSRGHQRSVRVQRGSHAIPRRAQRGAGRCKGLLRHGGHHHFAHPVRALPGGPGEGPHLRGHTQADGPAAQARYPLARRRRGERNPWRT